jgi:hypothetical protein
MRRLAAVFKQQEFPMARASKVRVAGGVYDCTLVSRGMTAAAAQRQTLLLHLFTNAVDPIARTANLRTAVRAFMHCPFGAA